MSAEWESRWEERSFRPAPSPIASVDTTGTSRVLFERGKGARERLTLDETFKTNDSREFVCHAAVEVPLVSHFGEHAGENAVELRRPPVKLTRSCTPSGFPEPDLSLPATSARYALRGDRLVPFAPLTERREYLPAY